MMKHASLQQGATLLSNLSNINIIMGRNGAGKSRFLRTLDSAYGHAEGFNVKYVSPERAGTFRRDGNVLTNISSDPNWLRNSRSVNQVGNFKAASAVLLREAEVIYLRRLATTPEIRNDPSRSFGVDRVSKINRLLTNLALEMGDADFQFRSLSTGDIVAPDHMSSGESEAVALASEILYFFDTIDPEKFNVLLLDEPDVHLHPDLQARLGKLIVGMLDEFSKDSANIAVCIATHSAPLVCALADSAYVSIGTKSFGVETVELKPAPAELRKVAPFFGHPLSLLLSDDAPLILEGEDDERVWQQAARSSLGRLKIFPVLATTIGQQATLEAFCVQLLSTLYDDPIAFSVRDGDGVIAQPLEHQDPLRRYRLDCYAIENCLVTDPCLATMNTTWPDFVEAAREWLSSNADHRDAEALHELVTADDRGRHTKIKAVRQLVCSVAKSTKPWEVVVGQTIGAISVADLTGDNMLVDFLGRTLVAGIVLRNS